MVDVKELLNSDFWREHQLRFCYAIVGVLLFVIFTIGTFPYDRALTSALEPAGLELSYSGQRPAFPLGAVLEDVRLVSLRQPEAQPLLRSDALQLAPGMGLLIGRPSVNLGADLYGGHLKASISRRADQTGIRFDLSALNLGQYHFISKLGTSVRGVVSGSGHLDLFDRQITSDSGDVGLDAHDLFLIVMRGLPAFSFSTLHGVMHLDHGVLEIRELTGRGADLAFNLKGSVRLMPVLAQSPLQLTLEVQPTATGRARLGMLMGMLPHPPGPTPYAIGGTLFSPTIS